MEAQLINKSDIKEFYGSLSLNLDDVKVDAHINRALDTELQDFLGPALYYDFMENYDINTDDKYKRLFEGEAYTYDSETIYFRGLRPYLIAVSFARILRNNSVNVTAYGNVVTVEEFSEQAEAFRERTFHFTAKDDAEKYKQEAERYLNEKKNDFPLWNKKRVNYLTKYKTSFNLNPIGRVNHR